MTDSRIMIDTTVIIEVIDHLDKKIETKISLMMITFYSKLRSIAKEEIEEEIEETNFQEMKIAEEAIIEAEVREVTTEVDIRDKEVLEIDKITRIGLIEMN